MDKNRLDILRWWLIAGIAMVVIQVMIGGITRLTESGLSMTRWEPVKGAFPPMSEAAWEKEFNDYKQSPEFQKVNSSFSLQEFKRIYWWEYIHRLWARILGLVFIIPFAFFLIRKWLDPPLIRKLIIILILGASQAVMGWIMVKSGLQDNPWVSPYRLTAHLLLALILFSYLIWVVLQLNPPNIEFQIIPSQRILFYVVFSLAVLQIIFGGFVAGTDAARMYNTFPTMNGQLIPAGLTNKKPLLINLFENQTTVQFIHRYLAIALSVGVVIFWHLSRSSMDPLVRRGANLLLLAIALQFLLGVLTITRSSPQQIHVPLGALHQAGAFLLMGILVFLHFVFWKSVLPEEEEEEELDEEIFTTEKLKVNH